MTNKNEKQKEEVKAETDTKQYKIGQIVYLRNATAVIPAQIVEEVTKTTIEGTLTTFNVKLKDNVISLNDLENQFSIFDDCNKIEVYLINQATSSIKNMLLEVKNTEKEWYSS